MKFAKVMFLHLSVSNSFHRGEYLGRYPLGMYTPRAGTPPGQVHPLGRYTPGQVHPQAGTSPDRYTHPQAGTPPAMHAGIRQVGSTHPTGMHSCYNLVLLRIT